MCTSVVKIRRGWVAFTPAPRTIGVAPASTNALNSSSLASEKSAFAVVSDWSFHRGWDCSH